MSFVSFEFLYLYVVVIALLIVIKNSFIRKLIILAASCFFYAWWDWRFLAILVFVTVMDYYISKLLTHDLDGKIRKHILLISVVINLCFLGFFKYFNFFIDSANVFTDLFGWHIGSLNIILPIGISFYTFETLSYVIDVYYGSTKPAKSLLDYAVFITFFPRLVAGPIMRASEFLPQLARGVKTNLPNIFEGIQLFLRGLIKKLVIADNAAIMVDQIYKSPNVLSSPTVWLGIFAYSIQIFCDFSGYTDMARGIGKTLGFDLPLNFNLPYTSQSMTEFWKRWHISLSTWLRDYLYIPLGGNQKGKFRTYINLMITMLLGGLWHGASWNFVLWGGLNGAYLAGERLRYQRRKVEKEWTSFTAWTNSTLIFILVSVTWVPFRSPDWNTTMLVFKKLMFFKSPYHFDWFYGWGIFAVVVVFIGGLIARRFKIDWPIVSFEKNYAIPLIVLEILIVFFFAPTNSSPFIYFQF
ncbi:MAG: MBOAT family protein [Bacteroidales bacterium]|nr:MBOAT family protein [Bacteroidales bacterium]